MRTLLWSSIILLIANLAIVIWNIDRTPKVAYVRSHDLVYGYFGMKEAMETFKSGQEKWTSQFDTLSADLQRSISQARKYQLEGESVELTRIEQVIRKQQQDLERYKSAMEKKTAEEEQRMIAGVLSQVNAFTERYARSHGFDVVLGTTDSGNLLYGDGDMDITEDLLAALNKDHQGLGE